MTTNKLVVKKTLSVYGIVYLVLLIAMLTLLYAYPKLELHLMLNACHTGFGDVFFRYYSILAEWPLYIIGLLPLLWKEKRLTLFYALCELSGGVVVQILKHLFHADRPIVAFEHHQDMLLPLVEGVELHHSNSFPSGHTSTFFVFFTCLALLLVYRYMQKGQQEAWGRRMRLHLSLIALLVLAALGGYSRIYLSQHFLSDVCVGSIIGIATPCLMLWFGGRILEGRGKRGEVREYSAASASAETSADSDYRSILSPLTSYLSPLTSYLSPLTSYLSPLKRIISHLAKPISLFAFSCIVSIATLLLYNIPFFNYVADNSNETAGGKLFLIASLIVVMLLLNFMATYLVMFLMKKVGRILLAILSVINATAVYFILNYSVIIDEITIGNVFNTKYSEASGFFSWGLWLSILGFGIIPAIYCLLQPVAFGKARRMGRYCGSALGLALVIAAMNYGQTLWISEHDTELGGLLQPWSYLVNTCRVASIKHNKQAEEIKLPDGRITNDEKTVVVLVIGESARKANFQLYGYERDTNPLLSKQEGLKVYQATSCATYTTAGTKAILEPKDSGDLYELLPNYAFRTGVDVVWRTSNWGEPPIHIDEYRNAKQLAIQYPDEDKDCDGLLFAGLRQRIESSKKNKVLIVLHTSTSHGPKYADKYPKEFEVYKPVVNNIEEGEKNVSLLVNAYDNTIRYTDYLLDSLINTLRTMTDWHSAMLFVSDHGESLGENKIFMHGLPKRIAPKVQYEIPFLVWTSEGFRDYKPVAGTQEAKEGELPAVIEQHYVFHSVLNLLSIQSPAYDKHFDIFQAEPSLP